MAASNQLQQDLLDVGDQLDRFAERVASLELESTDGLPSVGNLISLIHELERIGQDIMFLYRELSRSQSLDRRDLRDFERVATDLYANDSVPATVVLLRTLVRSKQMQDQDVERMSRSYGQVRINLSRAATVVIGIADALSES